MTVIWSERALHRLQQLHDYIARDQSINARRVIQRLVFCLAGALSTPRRCAPNGRRHA